ncbi:MAG: membrane protein insertase YidC [Sphingobacteriales bacterium]|jgi:YidC/Oxa1 family membrane protein insertase|nr:MAG: membrane protein insertase YidC [Sphingobacteriales bacterium]
MDKNTVTGIVLIILIWLVMSIYNTNQQKKFEEQKKKTQQTQIVKDSTSTKDSVNISNTNIVDTSANNTQIAADFGVFSNSASGTQENIVIENKDCIFTFSSKGAVLTKVELKNYKTYFQKPLILFSQNPEDFNFSLLINSAKKSIETSELYFTSNQKSTKIANNQALELVFNADNKYQHIYKIPSEGYILDFTAKANGLEKEIPQNAEVISLKWNQVLHSQERNLKEERIMSGVYYSDNEKNVDDIGLTKDKDQSIETPIQWISFSQKFFNTAIITESQNILANAQVKTTTGNDTTNIIKYLNANLKFPFGKNNNYELKTKIYVGPNSFKELKQFKNGMQKIIPIGGSVLGWINKFLVIPIFNFLHNFIPNYGIIILILAIIIKLITLPFTYKSQLSMVKMRVLKPELDELREKYGKDQATFGAKQMELYQQTGVSPFGGCLPMLLQWPFLIAMYRFFPSALELRQEKFLWANDLSTYDAFIKLPFNIPMLGDHLSLFAILGVVTSFAMTLYTMKNQPQQQGGGEFAEAMQKQMKIMQYIFPFMILFFFNSSSSALSYYFFLFNSLSLLQQWLMTRFLIDETAIRTQIEYNKKNPKKKSNFQQRMEEMMKQQQQIKNQKK